MRRILLGATLLLALILTYSAGARDIIQGDNCATAADQTYEGSLIVTCRTFEHHGTIEGDLLLAALTAEIHGTVAGNIYVLAGQLDVYNDIGRDVIFAGPVLRLHDGASLSDSRGSILSASLSTEIAESVTVPGSILSASYQLLASGPVTRDIMFTGAALTIDNTVTGKVEASVGDPANGRPSQLQALLSPFRIDTELRAPGLTVTENGQIDGQLYYSAPTEAAISGTLAQMPVYHPVITLPDFTQLNGEDDSNAAWVTNYLLHALRELISLAVIGGLLIFTAPRLVHAPLQQLRTRPLSSLGIGLLTFILSFAVWLVVLLLLLLAVFIFLALRLSDLAIASVMAIALLNIGGASAFYFIAIYVSRILVCLFVGRLLVQLTLGDDGTPRMLYLNLLAGTALLAALVYLPLVGSILNMIALALGLGAIFQALTTERSPRYPVPVPAMANRDTAQILPPPIVDDAPAQPGMNNLPDGFKWWDD